MRNFFVAFVVSALLIGCGGGSSQSDLAGSWTGKVGMSLQSMQDDVMADNEQSSFLNEQATQGSQLSLDLREDGTCTFKAFEPVEGTWSVEGSTVTLTLPERAGKSGTYFKGTYTLELSGDEMSGGDPNLSGVTITFER